MGRYEDALFSARQLGDKELEEWIISEKESLTRAFILRCHEFGRLQSAASELKARGDLSPELSELTNKLT